MSYVHVYSKVIYVCEERFLHFCPANALIFPFKTGGDALKTRQTKEILEDFLYENRCDKQSCLVAVGGGALLDLVGFVAATYLRGISYISCPTTLLSMTDAAIGGKTGINHGLAKNMIGAFYHPKAILVDHAFLQTLPLPLIVSGLSESIKHGLLGSSELFDYIEKHLDEILQKKMSKLLQLSIDVKKQVVQKDPFEQRGLRHILNLGHTVGHALESRSQFAISHGHAVAAGLRVEGWMAHRLGLISLGEMERVCALLNRLYPKEEILADLQYHEMVSDKKNRGQVPHFVALEGIGRVKRWGTDYVTAFDEKLFKKGVEDALRSY